MKSKILFVLVIAFLAFVSLQKGESISAKFIGLNAWVVGTYDDTERFIKDKINEHLFQKEEIARLRAQNTELEKSAVLLDTFAHEINQISSDKNSSAYEPEVKMVRALNYSDIGDYNKIWLDKFSDFNTSKIYGLIHQGKTAGIVITKNDRPLALLQGDPKSIFAVFVGEGKIPGIAHGDNDKIVVKFIPQWLFPKIGDEVFTSGLDGIFFGGVGVGRVTEVVEESLYKSVIVEPYVKLSIPSYLYVVTKEK